MAFKIIWSSNAVQDLERIGSFIERDSVFYAESIIQKIFDAPQSLIQHPEMGRVVPELNNVKIRELFVFHYRIIYEIKAKEIHFLTVIHGKRLLDTEKT